VVASRPVAVPAVARRMGYDPEPWPPNAAVDEEFADFAAAHQHVEAIYVGVTRRFAKCLDEHSPGSALVAAIDALVDEGCPGSFLRLGDGEGSLLALGSDAYPRLAEYCARNRSRKHLGDPSILVDQADTFVSRFEAALRCATVIGIPGPMAFAVTLHSDTHADRVGGAFGIGTVYDYLEQAEDLRLESKECSSSSFHYSLLLHYRVLMEGRSVGLVSCHHDLGGALRDRMGAERVKFHAVLAQAHLSRTGGHRPLSRPLQRPGPGAQKGSAADAVLCGCRDARQDLLRRDPGCRGRGGGHRIGR
jgi:hypothetical protein